MEDAAPYSLRSAFIRGLSFPLNQKSPIENRKSLELSLLKSVLCNGLDRVFSLPIWYLGLGQTFHRHKGVSLEKTRAAGIGAFPVR